MDRLQILWVTRSQFNAGASVKPHTHPYFHMFHLAEGSIRFMAGGNTYQLHSGHTILVPPNTEHSYVNDSDTCVEHLEIKFTLGQSPFQEGRVSVTDDVLAKELSRQILKEFSDLAALANESATAYLTALLEFLSGSLRYEKQTRQFKHLDASGCSALSQQIIHYLENHYSEDFSLDALAEAMGYNKSYLCVAFKKDTKQTILDCLNMIRIRKAAELIVYSDQTLTQVSEMCGFSSVSHFNRVFLKYAGITPGQCRRAYPPDILSGFKDMTKDLDAKKNYFMYSVLAQKQISLDIVTEADKQNRKEISEPQRRRCK